MNLFCITEKELCCSVCQFLKPHEGHKLILVNDLESLKKEGLTIESSTVDFDQNNKLITDLKKQIELEFDKINNLYEKTNNQVVVFFKEKHEKLIEEERKLKEKLENEVTKIKEKLEKHLTDCNNIIKRNEKIKSGITKLKNNKENNNEKLYLIFRQ